MQGMVEAFRQVATGSEFREIERLRSKARHDEAHALKHAAMVEREKWQAVVAEKDASLAERDASLAEQHAIIVKLRARLGEDSPPPPAGK